MSIELFLSTIATGAPAVKSGRQATTGLKETFQLAGEMSAAPGVHKCTSTRMQTIFRCYRGG